MEGTALWNDPRGVQDAFPLAVRYAELRELPAASSTLREPRAGGDGFTYTERHLQCVWFDSRWRPPALTSLDGEPVLVLSPGRWNLEAGPDFLGAMLEVGSDRRRIGGDVEIHVHPTDWTQHGHAADPRYANLAAHVTFFGGSASLPGLPPSTIRIALREALRAAPAFSFDLVDVTAYPFSALPVSAPPCAGALAGWSREAREALLVSAAHERMRQKALRMAARVAEAGAAQTFYEEVMTALGYKHNRAAFLTLARRVPADGLASEAQGDPARAYAALAGVAGLLPADAPRGCDDETRTFVRSLWDAWWRLPS